MSARADSPESPPMEILAPVPLPQALMSALETRFALHRMFAAPDPEALVESVRDRIRAIACGAGILTDGAHFRIDAAFMKRFPRLEIIANLGVGYEHIDAAWAGRHGVIVTNTPDVLTDEVADLALGLLLATVREIPQADRYLRAGLWKTRPFRLTASLRGRRLGILGLGRIGSAVAARAEAFGLTIAYHGRRRQPVPYAYFATPAELARACDILMVVAPGGAQTRHLVNHEVLAALGPEGVLINVARGSLIDEDALISALKTGAIAAAGLDVFTAEPHVPTELIAMDNVVLLPHVGSGSRETRAAMGRLVIDNLASWARGEGPLTPVAETSWIRSGGSS